MTCLCPCYTRHPGQPDVCTRTAEAGQHCEPCTAAAQSRGRGKRTAKITSKSRARRSDRKPPKGAAA